MKKAWAVIPVLIACGIIAACSKKGGDSRVNGDEYGVCYGYNCKDEDGNVRAGGGYGYVGGGRWRGKVVVYNAAGFQAMMKAVQNFGCYYGGCVISADYADIALVLEDTELPQQTQWAFRSVSGGYMGQTIYQQATAFATKRKGLNGFVLVSSVVGGVTVPYLYNQTSTVANRPKKIEIYATFLDESRRYLSVKMVYAGRTVATGELHGKATYGQGSDYDGPYRSDRRRYIDREDRAPIDQE